LIYKFEGVDQRDFEWGDIEICDYYYLKEVFFRSFLIRNSVKSKMNEARQLGEFEWYSFFMAMNWPN